MKVPTHREMLGNWIEVTRDPEMGYANDVMAPPSTHTKYMLAVCRYQHKCWEYSIDKWGQLWAGDKTN